MLMLLPAYFYNRLWVLSEAYSGLETEIMKKFPAIKQDKIRFVLTSSYKKTLVNELLNGGDGVKFAFLVEDSKKSYEETTRGAKSFSSLKFLTKKVKLLIRIHIW